MARIEHDSVQAAAEESEANLNRMFARLTQLGVLDWWDEEAIGQTRPGGSVLGALSRQLSRARFRALFAALTNADTLRLRPAPHIGTPPPPGRHSQQGRGEETRALTIFLVATAVAVLVAVTLGLGPVRDSPTWRAMATPLASIIGSGFLICGPLLAREFGGVAIWAMAALLALAYALGAVE